MLALSGQSLTPINSDRLILISQIQLYHILKILQSLGLIQLLIYLKLIVVSLFLKRKVALLLPKNGETRMANQKLNIQAPPGQKSKSGSIIKKLNNQKMALRKTRNLPSSSSIGGAQNFSSAVARLKKYSRSLTLLSLNLLYLMTCQLKLRYIQSHIHAIKMFGKNYIEIQELSIKRFQKPIKHLILTICS